MPVASHAEKCARTAAARRNARATARGAVRAQRATRPTGPVQFASRAGEIAAHSREVEQALTGAWATVSVRRAIEGQGGAAWPKT